ncbi:hypothetical protein BDV97DRAFT_371524 [Delphinella strobiligena]|nr:hypothetical protein BDV97DRAFT_371524 [Delphinella strobiligena]
MQHSHHISNKSSPSTAFSMPSTNTPGVAPKGTTMSASTSRPPQPQATKIPLLAQKVRAPAANKQVLHLPFAAVDDWALECFFDPIDNENQRSTLEQDRLRGIRIAGYVKEVSETLDEMREIGLVLFLRCGGEQGGQIQARTAASTIITNPCAAQTPRAFPSPQALLLLICSLRDP